MESLVLWMAGAAGVIGLLGGGVAWLVLYPFLPRDLGGARNLDDVARKVRIPVGSGDAIDGWHLAGRRSATVLLLHGFGRNHHRVWRYGECLHRAGFGVLVIDFRSSRARTSGRRLPTTLGHHEVPDAEAALDWIEREPSLAGHTIGVLGESMGGAVGLIVAARRRSVEAVAVDGAFASSAQAIMDSSERWARIPGRPTVALARAFGRAMTGCDPGAMSSLDACACLADRPIFFVHGTHDRRVGVEHVRLLWAAAGRKDEVWVVDGAGHNESWRMHREEYERRLIAFFDRTLAAPDPGEAPAPARPVELGDSGSLEPVPVTIRS